MSEPGAGAGASVAERLVRLYPAAFRERWGEELVQAARAEGRSAWPDLLRGVADAWLHPMVWPADSRAQRRGRAGVLALAVALFTLLLGQLSAEQGALLASVPGGSWLVRVCAGLVLLGLALVAPRPAATRAAAGALLSRAVRLLAVPVLVAAGVVVVAHLDHGPAGLWEHLAVGCWYVSLGAAAVQGCRVVAGLSGVGLAPPGEWRLRTGLWSLVGGGLLTGAVALSATLRTAGPDPWRWRPVPSWSCRPAPSRRPCGACARSEAGSGVAPRAVRRDGDFAHRRRGPGSTRPLDRIPGQLTSVLVA